MRDFFSLEGPFNKYGGMIADMVLVSLMWLLFCLPIVTIGASTTAMFYVTTRRIAEREGYITSDFWTAFKANIRKATIMWMIILVALILLLMNVLLLTNDEVELAGGIFGIVLPAQLVFLFVIAIMSVYIYPLMARFDMGLVQVVKSAFYMSVRHFLTSVSCVVMAVAAFLLFFRFPPLILVAPGLYAWLSSYMIMKVFKKYRPEMDRDPSAEIAEIEAKKAEERWKRERETPAPTNTGESEEDDIIDAEEPENTV
ncbi:MAG: DUF624 domain-containing protein [Defluviitaleaceae bacterium]|nr:DUF624 domain-containing protein [Defluviitaleaceae bacterium]